MKSLSFIEFCNEGHSTTNDAKIVISHTILQIYYNKTNFERYIWSLIGNRRDLNVISGTRDNSDLKDFVTMHFDIFF